MKATGKLPVNVSLCQCAQGKIGLVGGVLSHGKRGIHAVLNISGLRSLLKCSVEVEAKSRQA